VLLVVLAPEPVHAVRATRIAAAPATALIARIRAFCTESNIMADRV
jgi:hypothetical protein